MRLDKMLAHAGFGTRKEVKEYIRKGFVLVNGETITDDDYKVDELTDEVIIADSKVKYDALFYYMLNKPKDYISATYDNNLPVVLDLFKEPLRDAFPVGRLDIDTTGLLIITNDGALAHKLLSPKNHVDKRYMVWFTGRFKPEYLVSLKEGITLDDGYKTMPASFEILSGDSGIITIQEGKYHQVKRMMEALNMKVTDLKRISFGPIALDDTLEEGEYRPLSKQEIELLLHH